MLYVDQVAATEAEAVEAACRLLRLSNDEVSVKDVTRVPEGIKVRVEAKRSRGQEALLILKKLLANMGIEADLFYIESFDRITINIKGPELGLVIGRNGTTLDALETLVSAMHNKTSEFYKPVVLNPDGYRESKRVALRALVARAVEAASTGHRVSLPPMGQRDRRQIHQIIKEFPGFRSRSVGDGSDRRVFIFHEAEDETGAESEVEDMRLPPGACDNGRTGLEARP
jgi:spoIIIJ-associated protein